MKAALYARYSTELQSDSSVEDQFSLCRQLVARSDGLISAEYYDAAISGSSMVNRPALLDLMRDAKQGRFDTLVCESLDRLSRDQEDIAGIFKRLNFLNIKIITLADGAVSSIHIGLKGTMAALYIEDLRQKTRRGQIGRVNAGRIPGGKCYGYDVERSGDERGLRTINAPEAKIVKRIFEQYRQGMSPIKIATALNKSNIPAPRGGQWNASTINGSRKRLNGILNNELYIGQLVYNRQSFVKDPDTGKRQARPNPPEQWIRHDLPDLRLIDQNTWDQVHAMRQQVGSQHLSRRARPKHLLSGLIKCATCGGNYIVKNRDRLGCSTFTNKGTCDNNRTITLTEIECRVLEGLRKYLLEPEIVGEAIEAYRLEMKRLRAAELGTRTALARKLGEINRKIDNLITLVENGADPAAMAHRINELQNEKQEIERRIGTADNKHVIELHPSAAQSYRAMVAQMQSAISKNNEITQDLRQTIRSLVQEIRIIPTKGKAPLKLDIIGDLAMLLSQDKNKSTIAMVAGACNGWNSGSVPVRFHA